MNETAPASLRTADWERDAAALEALRGAVFVEEQGVPKNIEWDGQDASAQHVIAELDGQTVGCGRLLSDGRIGRLAVAAPLRGRGLGARILAKLVELAQDRGLPAVYLHAQAAAEAFYQRAGFIGDGPLFDEAGIAHRNMRRELDYRLWNRPLLGVGWPQPFAQLVVAQASLARRELTILSPSLDSTAFGDPQLSSEITRMLRRAGARSRVRILVQDVRAVIESGAALLQLTRRLPSAMGMRVLEEHPDWDGETRVIRDRDSLLRMPAGERGGGSYMPDSRARAETALKQYEDFWRAAREHPELRRMAL